MQEAAQNCLLDAEEELGSVKVFLLTLCLDRFWIIIARSTHIEGVTKWPQNTHNPRTMTDILYNRIL